MCTTGKRKGRQRKTSSLAARSFCGGFYGEHDIQNAVQQEHRAERKLPQRKNRQQDDESQHKQRRNQMTGGKAAGLDAHRAANPIAVAPFLIELTAERLARRMPRENIGGKVEAVSCLAHAVVHVVVLRVRRRSSYNPTRS